MSDNDCHTQIVVCKAGRTWVRTPSRRVRGGNAMTFNEGMQIDTTNISTGGGRGPGRGIAIGGGLGGLLIVVIALFLGVDPSTVVPQQGQIATGGVDAPGYDLNHCKTGADANKYVECRVVATRN